jgi:signal transduction histidine kinase
MKTALLVTADAELRARLTHPLQEYSLFFARTDTDAVATLQVAPVDLVIKDASTEVRDLAGFVTRSRELSPSVVVVAIGDDEEIGEEADFGLSREYTPRQLALTLRQADERHRLLRELTALRPEALPLSPPAIGATAGPGRSLLALEQALGQLAKALGAGFDLPRTVEVFLDAVDDMVRPSRSALLRLDPGASAYRIYAHRRLAPCIVESVHLSTTAGVPRWLVAQGRPLAADMVRFSGADVVSRDAARELALLQAVMAVPLLADGELVAILALGQRIVGGGYERREIEMLFTLAAPLGAAIRDIQRHQRLREQKTCYEEILAHIGSGVIAIGRDEKISLINPRAAEILQVPAASVLNHDLRALPSPLGDLLFETMSLGRSLTPREIRLAWRGLVLEVSTYPIMGDQPRPLGAILVAEDLGARRAVAAEERQADQRRCLTSLVARITEEITNPFVSVQTLMDLFEERYHDPDFRHQVSTVAIRDVRRVTRFLDKLTGLGQEPTPNLGLVDLGNAVEEMLGTIRAVPKPTDEDGTVTFELTEEPSGKHVLVRVGPATTIASARADQSELKRALAYLVWYLIQRSPGEQAKLSIVFDDTDSGPALSIASRTARTAPEELDRLLDPLWVIGEGRADIGPAVSQRLITAQGGQLQLRQGRHELRFLVTLVRSSA